MSPFLQLLLVMPPWNQTTVPEDVLLPGIRQTPTGISGAEATGNIIEAFSSLGNFLEYKVSVGACAKANAALKNNKMQKNISAYLSSTN